MSWWRSKAQGNEAFRPYVWVILEEVASGQWGVGGHGLTPEDLRGLIAAAGRHGRPDHQGRPPPAGRLRDAVGSRNPLDGGGQTP